MTETKNLVIKYAKEIPSYMQTLNDDGSINYDVPNGTSLTMNILPLIEGEVFPAIVSRFTKDGDTTVLYKTADGLRIAYQGAGVEYQTSDGLWKDTSGIPVSEYFDKPQRISHALQHKYGIASVSGSKVTIHLVNASAEYIVSQEVSIP